MKIEHYMKKLSRIPTVWSIYIYMYKRARGVIGEGAGGVYEVRTPLGFMILVFFLVNCIFETVSLLQGQSQAER